MLRSIFFSAGLFVTLWGVSFLFVDKVVVKGEMQAQRQPGFRGLFSRPVNRQQEKIIAIPAWASFSLMSVGAVTMLYAAALPRAKAD